DSGNHSPKRACPLLVRAAVDNYRKNTAREWRLISALRAAIPKRLRLKGAARAKVRDFLKSARFVGFSSLNAGDSREVSSRSTDTAGRYQSSDFELLRHQLAVVVRVAPHQLHPLLAPEVELDLVFLGEADAAVDLLAVRDDAA